MVLSLLTRHSAKSQPALHFNLLYVRCHCMGLAFGAQVKSNTQEEKGALPVNLSVFVEDHVSL